MKSIKPGRGPSLIGGIMSILIGVFGLLWTIVVAYGGGGFFALFGLVFVAIAVVQAIYNFKNATGENRYSSFDITDDWEEPDPLNQRFGQQSANKNPESGTGGSAFCPYCGAKVEGSFAYCNKCGRKLP